MSRDAALVLAAGKGTRMRSNLPKVLHRVAGKPMLLRVLDSLAAAGFPCPTVVVGFGAEQIELEVGPRCEYVLQREQLGTGHAARLGMEALPATTRRVLLVHGDEPLIDAEIYQRMLDLQTETGSAAVILTTDARDLRGFGRVVRDPHGAPIDLVQESELRPEQRSLTEVNLGAYVFDAAFLRDHLPHLQPHPPKGEYYLTDLLAVARREGKPVEAVQVEGGEEIMGINDLVHLEHASRGIYRRTNRRLMESGVTILDSASTFVDEDARIEPDTIIHPFTIISGPSLVGAGSEVGPGSHIVRSEIGRRCRILSSTIRDSVVGDDVFIGPYAHVRDRASIGPGAQVGTGSEIKASTLGPGTKMRHFGFVGDAEVGANVNIGAGVITCNFDGVSKHRTLIGADAFIGSDTLLRAPIEVGEGAFTGAGSVVTKNVSPRTTVAGMPARAIRRRPPEEDRNPAEERGA